MSSDVIIRVSNLGKSYRIQHQGEKQRYTALRDVIAEKAKRLFRRNSLSASNGREADATLAHRMGEGLGVRASGKVPSSGTDSSDVRISKSQNFSASRTEDFWAIKDVSFEVRQGEVVGIIGLPREIDFHQPTHWTGKCTQFVCRAGHAELPFHRGTQRGREKHAAENPKLSEP